MRLAKVSSSIGKTIRVSDRDGHGIAVHQGEHMIRMSNADVLAFVNAVVQIASTPDPANDERNISSRPTQTNGV